MRQTVNALEAVDRGVLRERPPRFALDRRVPPGDLAGRVDLHWSVAWDLPPGERHVQGVLPFPCFNIAWALPEGVRVHGPVTRRYDRVLEGRGRGVGTRLSAGTFPGLTGWAAADLTDREASLGELFGADGDALERRLEGASFADFVAAVEDFLRARPPAPDPAAELAARVVEHMLAQPVGARVAEVAVHFALSPRSLQRLFRRYVGLSPKAVLQRSRAHEAAQRVEAGADDGASLALDLGYSDQAHFINDFREAVGRPPSRY
jgi:AraC-like DNA-binding protein